MKLPPWLFFIFLGSLLLLPDIWSSTDRYGNTQFGPPRLTGGDEPYYMVIISSLLEDGDFDLRNNYDEALAGGWQAGLNFRGRPIGHHSCWFEGAKRSGWSYYYGKGDQERWVMTPEKKIVPVPLVPGVEPAPNQPDYSFHPPGSVLAILPVLWAVEPVLHAANRMDLIESVALLCSGLQMLVAAFFFWKLIRQYVADPNTAYIITTLAFLGTPAWHYGRSLFPEPLLTMCTLAAYSLVLRGKSPVIAAIFIGVGMLSKPPFLLVAVPLAGYLWWKKDFAGGIKAAIPIAVACLCIFALNTLTFGGPFRSAMPWKGCSIFEGAPGLLISPDHGMFAFVPIALLALFAWPAFWREYRAEGTAVLAGFALFFLLMALWWAWWGGYCYGPRYLVPVIPLFLVPLAWALENYRSIWTHSLFWTLACISVLINGYAAIPYWTCWAQNPLFLFLGQFFPGLHIPLRS